MKKKTSEGCWKVNEAGSHMIAEPDEGLPYKLVPKTLRLQSLQTSAEKLLCMSVGTDSAIILD